MKTPASSAGAVDVTVTSNGQTSTLADAYTFIAAPTSGGPKLAFTGVDLTAAPWVAAILLLLGGALFATRRVRL